MSNKPKNRPPKHRSLTTDQFARKVDRVYQKVSHGYPAIMGASQLRDRWRQLDPIDTAREPNLPLLAGALGRIAAINGDVRKRKHHWPFQEFCAAAMLDLAGVELRLSRDDPTAIHGRLNAVRESMGRSKTPNPELSFEALSAEAMALFLRAQEGQDSRVYDDLGMLIKQSVMSARSILETIQVAQKNGGNGSHLVGSMVEALCFSYVLADKQRTQKLDSGYARLALFREDHPRGPQIPSRSFDLTVVSSDVSLTSQLLQAKASSASVADYAPEITLWTPPGNIVQDADRVCDWFDTVVDNEVPDSAIGCTWQKLDAMFAPPVEFH